MIQAEKEMRLARATLGVVSGKEIEFTKCPNGKECKWCKKHELI